LIALQRIDLGVVGLISVGAGVLGSFGALSWTAARSNAVGRVLAIVEVSVLFGGSWVWVLAAGVVSAGCENCDPTGLADTEDHWWHHEHAWQRNAQLALALLGLAVLLFALRQTVLRRHTLAVAVEHAEASGRHPAARPSLRPVSAARAPVRIS
jgi:hypothetical protein